jgi:hypothetical protein
LETWVGGPRREPLGKLSRVPKTVMSVLYIKGCSVVVAFRLRDELIDMVMELNTVFSNHTRKNLPGTKPNTPSMTFDRTKSSDVE